MYFYIVYKSQNPLTSHTLTDILQNLKKHWTDCSETWYIASTKGHRCNVLDGAQGDDGGGGEQWCWKKRGRMARLQAKLGRASLLHH